MKKHLVLLTIGVLELVAAAGQRVDLGGFKNFSKSVITPILENREVKGYTVFYLTDKADKKNDNYHLAVYDENLNPVKKLDMEKPRENFIFNGNAYNGKELGLYYYNLHEQQFEIEAYTMDLLKKATAAEPYKMDPWIAGIYFNTLKDMETEKGTFSTFNIFPVNNAGFITIGVTANGKYSFMNGYDGELKKKWTYSSKDDSKAIDYNQVIEANDSYIITHLMRRPNRASMKATYFNAVYDAGTGKKLTEIPDKDEQIPGSAMMTNFIYDYAAKQLIRIGQYVEDDKATGSKNRGFYIKAMDATGNEKNKKQYSWEEVLKSGPSSQNQGAISNEIHISKALVSGGKIYLVCEQYARSTEAADKTKKGAADDSIKTVSVSIFVAVLSTGDFAVKEFKLFPNIHSVSMTPTEIQHYLKEGFFGHHDFREKLSGLFRYQFTMVSNDNKSIDVVFLFKEDSTGEKTEETYKRRITSIIIRPDDKIALDNIDVESKTEDCFLYPAKAGYLMMVDYLKKENNLGMKLVKINY